MKFYIINLYRILIIIIVFTDKIIKENYRFSVSVEKIMLKRFTIN